MRRVITLVRSARDVPVKSPGHGLAAGGVLDDLAEVLDRIGYDVAFKVEACR